jgi:hypothetical protein
MFDYTDTTLLKYNEQTEEQETKEALQEYFEKVNEK